MTLLTSLRAWCITALQLRKASCWAYTGMGDKTWGASLTRAPERIKAMHVLMILALAFAPGLFWLWYFFKKDRVEPEPLHRIRSCFFLGMASVIPAGFIEMPSLRLPEPIRFVIVAPLVEELVKFLVVRFAVYKTSEFDEPMDGMVYAAAVALGFASLENVYYLLTEYGKGPQSFAFVTVVRALLSVPGHALWSCMWGYALGFAKFSEPELGRSLVIEGLLLAMGMHALFNLLCLSGPIWPLGMLLIVPAMWRMTHRRIEAALRASPHTFLSDDREGREPRTSEEEGSDSSSQKPIT